MHLPKFMIFGAYKLHEATNKKMLTFVSTLVRQRAL